MSLAVYRRKRDFKRTAEPTGTRKRAAKQFAYVIQKHAASHLHYDFRLELGGVLKSWAVPKGPSLDPKEKRLAIQVEDHPLDYAGFEGTIPKGQYGGGSVLLWDRGHWTPHGDPHEGLRRGRLSFDLAGEKLRGKWIMIRIRGRDSDGGKVPWLLMKEADEFARSGKAHDILVARPESVTTDRTIEEIGAGRPGGSRVARERVWESGAGLHASRLIRADGPNASGTLHRGDGAPPGARTRYRTLDCHGRFAAEHHGGDAAGSGGKPGRRQGPNSDRMIRVR